MMHGHRVLACSPAARAEGVARHQRQREAQARCPELVLVDHDPATEARVFEPVAAALEDVTPRIEIVEPGCCSFPTRGPSRYHGGDEALAELTAQVAGRVVAGRCPVRVGIADGAFAARLAARSHQAAPGPLVVAPGGSRAFLADRSVDTLDRPALTEVLHRLGLRTLGALAELAAADIMGRFGTEGLAAHRLASGLDERPPATRKPPEDLTVVAELDPPAERLEAAAFIARGLAEDLHRRLLERGSACTQLLIGAETEHGEHHERVWRTDGAFSAGAIAARVRWQIDGWLTSGVQRPTSGLTRLWLTPDEIVPAGGRQLALTAAGPAAIDAVDAADRAARALARVEALLGPEAVLVPEQRGGRSPGERVRLVPAAAVDITEPRPETQPNWVTEPWPGQIPPPAPALVHDPPLPVEVLDAAGRPVGVDGRSRISAPPATLVLGSDRRHRARITSWAGPWPCAERWWDPDTRRRRARLQAVDAAGAAYLLVLEHGRWGIEATYD